MIRRIRLTSAYMEPCLETDLASFKSRYKMRFLLFLIPTFILFSACQSGIPLRTEVDPTEPIKGPGELVFKEDEELQQNIASIASDAKGQVGVFALLIEEERSVSLNGSDHFALQSVVKLPVTMAVIERVESGDLKLDDPIKFTKDDLVNRNQHSPLRDKYPFGGTATVRELISMALTESDGSACDILTRVLGGPGALQSFVDGLGIEDVHTPRTHKEFGKAWELQYENWATPEATVSLLEILFKNAYPSGNFPPAPGDVVTQSRIIVEDMAASKPGPNRLKGMLPPGTPVAHKTGTGGTREGVTSATNDVGIITMPDGRHIAIAVFVGDSAADLRTREGVIARIAKALWDTWSVSESGN